MDGLVHGGGTGNMRGVLFYLLLRHLEALLERADAPRLGGELLVDALRVRLQLLDAPPQRPAHLRGRESLLNL